MRISNKGAAARKQACLLLRGSQKRLPLSAPDRAFAERLFRETVVWKKYLDYVLNRYTSRPLSKLDAEVIRSLRVGAVQLLVLGTPAHAAVSATVEAHENRRAKGLINAVLRKTAGFKGDRKLPLHVRYSHPEQLVNRWITQMGREKTESFLKWNNSVPELGGYAFGDSPQGSSPGKYLDRYRVLAREGSVKPPAGFYIQDESASIVGRGMAELPGDTVLEIGAAPGGKTAHLQQAGVVISVDSKPDRMKKWLQNCSRLGWQNSLGVAAMSSALPFNRRFTKVLVDVPCTNTGVYRRRYDARWKWTANMHTELLQMQRRMLLDSSKAVKSGGVLVYSTCSIDTEENREAALHFQETNTCFERIAFPAPRELVDEDGFLSYFPPDAGIDGLFAAAWKRR